MTSVWGKHFWHTIHMAALGYPVEPSPMDQIQYKAFYVALGNVLPCGKCSANYGRHFAEMPVDDALRSRDALFAWTVAFHNVVNRETGKREWTVQEAQDSYKRMFGGKGVADGGSNGGNSNSVRDSLLVVNTLLSVVLAIVVLASFIYFRTSK